MEWRIYRALALMYAEISRPLHVATLAKEMNLSPSRFSHLFRHETGQSPAHYLHDLRLDRALLLLKDTALSIKQVMAAVGINDPSHFARDFSERHGVSPTAFRALAQAFDDQSIVDTSSSSRNGQQTAGSANDAFRVRGSCLAHFEAWRDERAEGA
jgi:AraC family transcriptional regulator of arabinose operon